MIAPEVGLGVVLAWARVDRSGLRVRSTLLVRLVVFGYESRCATLRQLRARRVGDAEPLGVTSSGLPVA